MPATITKVERRTRPAPEPSLVFPALTADSHGDQYGWYAEVTTATGCRVQLSRLDGDDRWIADALFSKTGVPVFVNGYGSRCTQLMVATPHMSTALNEAIAAQKEV